MACLCTFTHTVLYMFRIRIHISPFGSGSGFYNKNPEPWHWFQYRKESIYLKSVVTAFYGLYSLVPPPPQDCDIVSDFTISVYGSLFKFLFFSLILAPLLSFSIYWQPPRLPVDGRPKNKQRMKKKIIRPKKRAFHELPITEFVKIRDYETHLGSESCP